MPARKLIFAQECRLIERTRSVVSAEDETKGTAARVLIRDRPSQPRSRWITAFSRSYRTGQTQKEKGRAGQDLKGVARYFPFKGNGRYPEFISQWRHGQLGLQPDRAIPSDASYLDLVFFFLQQAVTRLGREPETWLYITPYITHYITPYVSPRMLAQNLGQRTRGCCSSRVTHRQIDFLTTLYVILYARCPREDNVATGCSSIFGERLFLSLSLPGDKLSRLLCALHDPPYVAG